ncbi:hypothetical protein QBC37DRAFT_159486 [Rhypophila decipiens]|uniref:Uncharacterized protein n=1 Tax=Rhypophila decipiens TaxID=261697 RepID=A0AAN6XSL3_9PEZI|nr:hypothetical protein QBC37DRAFT_159486 [Rhypophila decipiens]
MRRTHPKSVYSHLGALRIRYPHKPKRKPRRLESTNIGDVFIGVATRDLTHIGSRSRQRNEGFSLLLHLVSVISIVTFHTVKACLLDKGELTTDSYLATAQFREKYLRHDLTLPAKTTQHDSTGRSRQPRAARPANDDSAICEKFNASLGCLWANCKRRHECKSCGLNDHSAASCRKGK